jgi:hypothetical protein
MSNQPDSPRLSRRDALAGLGAAGVVLAHAKTPSLAQETAVQAQTSPARYLSVPILKAQATQPEGAWLETCGFYAPGDGGGALYQVQRPSEGLRANDADVIALDGGLLAVLHERRAVNYRMFGAVGDGENDDGVQIKRAHEYANRHGVPVVNPTGEFWIKQTHEIPIRTAVQWGGTLFHIDERFNSRSMPRFRVENDRPARDLTKDEALHGALLKQLKPGVQIIPELAPYANHLLVVQDDGDRIGIRAGYAGNRGWAREELFYVEEEGRIIGDIAWGFKNFTSVRAIPCNENYLVISGGGFRFSGDTPQGSGPGYHHNGIQVQRSRTIIREQWMGLEPGKRDMSLEPRRGLYALSHVYDVTLENIRAVPWEKNRRPPEKAVAHGTYGISGARMLNCVFRNLTAEAGPVAWGVFGTNLNKNFRLERCRLNRVDVHFHCWNLHVTGCTLGFKGITVTGGGELLVENTTRHGNNFINFRPDYGAKWDGPIRIRNCTLQPSSNGRVTVLSMRPSDFDYQYPLGLGTSVAIEDLRIDYAGAPASQAECRLMDIPAFARNRKGDRLLFPQSLVFRDITVVNREQGVHLLQIPNPYHYDLRRPGGVDDSGIETNCTLVCERVQLAKLQPASPDDPRQAHLVLGGREAVEYTDARALFPKIVFQDCGPVVLHVSHCAAQVAFQRCTVNTVRCRQLRGELAFTNCRLRPEVQGADGDFYALDSTLGTRFTNCTVHAPVVKGEAKPELMDRIGFLEINRALRHYHLNTGLGHEVLRYCREQRIELSPDFVAKLKCRHELEP